MSEMDDLLGAFSDAQRAGANVNALQDDWNKSDFTRLLPALGDAAYAYHRAGEACDHLIEKWEAETPG